MRTNRWVVEYETAKGTRRRYFDDRKEADAGYARLVDRHGADKVSLVLHKQGGAREANRPAKEAAVVVLR